MTSITIELPDDLAERVRQLGERLPEVLVRGLEGSTAPAALYHTVLEFLASNPTPAELARLAPPLEARARLQALLARERDGNLAPGERTELDAYEHLEHLIIMLKAANLPRVPDNE